MVLLMPEVVLLHRHWRYHGLPTVLHSRVAPIIPPAFDEAVAVLFTPFPLCGTRVATQLVGSCQCGHL